MNIVKLAKQTATSAHAGHFRRDGVTTYITHPENVAARVAWLGSIYETVAWLHDVIEDTDITLENLKELGFSFEVLLAVSLLTKKKGQSYKDYLESIKSNPVALGVKSADIMSNLSDSPTARQVDKYTEGMKVLFGSI